MKKTFLKHSAGKMCIFFGPHKGMVEVQSSLMYAVKDFFCLF